MLRQNIWIAVAIALCAFVVASAYVMTSGSRQYLDLRSGATRTDTVAFGAVTESNVDQSYFSSLDGSWGDPALPVWEPIRRKSVVGDWRFREQGARIFYEFSTLNALMESSPIESDDIRIKAEFLRLLWRDGIGAARAYAVTEHAYLKNRRRQPTGSGVLDD